jgi:hypothetical protein
MKKQDWSPRPPKPKPSGQPEWEFVANLGDVNPFDYGGYFVHRDKTGVYPEEAELLVVDDEESETSTYTVYGVVLDRLKMVDGYLVPFKYDSSWPHPVERYDEWFHEKLGDVADSIGTTKEELEEAFTSADPIIRADAYRVIGDYHGWENLDHDPLTSLSRAEVEERYPEVTRGRSV